MLSGAPYGYRYVGKAEGGGEARYEIVLEEARVVRQVFAWVGRERLSPHCAIVDLPCGLWRSPSGGLLCAWD